VALRGERVVAGPTSSAVIDRQGMYWLAGKWKISGDGSSGQPYSTYRYFQDISSCRMMGASHGGVTHFCFCTTEDDKDVMTIAWGQSANNYELGLGDGQPKSSTKPVEVQPLNGINVFDIAAGAHTTFFLASPNGKLSDRERYPEVDSIEECLVCKKPDDEEGGATLLECEKCENPYHLHCLTPPLSAVPEGEWFCPKCTAEAESRQHPSADVSVSSNKKRSREAEVPNSASDAHNPEDDAEGSDEETGEQHPLNKSKNNANGHSPSRRY